MSLQKESDKNFHDDFGKNPIDWILRGFLFMG